MPTIQLISFFFIFLPLFSHENSPIGLVNHIGEFSRLKRSVPGGTLRLYLLNKQSGQKDYNNSDYIIRNEDISNFCAFRGSVLGILSVVLILPVLPRSV